MTTNTNVNANKIRPGRAFAGRAMHRILPRILVGLMIVVCAARAQEQFGPPVTQGQTLQTSNMTDSAPLIPGDIYRPGVAHADLATFAWLEFIAVVAEAGSTRGTPGGSFAQSGQNPGDTLVWETFQHRSELLPYNNGQPIAPQPWDSKPKYVMHNGASPEAEYIVPYSNYNNLDEASQIGQNLLFFPQQPGNPQPSTDWQVLFEAKVNQAEWSFVNENYNSFPDFAFGPFRFTTPITLPTNTVEIKAGWRPIDSIPTDQRYRYHTANVIYYTGADDDPAAQVGEYALIALHIIHKTDNFPAFVFATFEQVDSAVVNQATGELTGLYYKPTYAVDPDNPDNCPGDVCYTLNSGSTFGFETSNPIAKPNGQAVKLPLGPAPKTVTVVQPQTTNADVATVNKQALKAMQGIKGFDKNFVWQYYTLKGVQGVPTSDETAEDFYLANIVVESSQPGLQLFRGGGTDSPSPNVRNLLNVCDAKQTTGCAADPGTNAKFSVGGCQGCHGVAQTQNNFDFSFLYFAAKGNGFNPDTSGSKETVVMQTRSKKYKAR